MSKAKLEDPRYIATLTPLQHQMVRMMAQGKSNAEIAAILHYTEGTLKQYITVIYARLGVHNRTQAAVRAHALGLLK